MPVTEGNIDVAGTTKKLDTTTVTQTDTTTTHREAVVVADPETNAARAAVKNTPPSLTDYGLVVHPIVNKTAFGELSVANLHPIVQLQFPYNVNSRLVMTNLNGSGAATVTDSLLTVTTGTDSGSTAMMMSQDAAKYHSGQGTLARYTAIFTAGVADTTQEYGYGLVTDGFFFGYNGADFGVLSRTGGARETQTLTISAGAGTATGHIHITLDGIPTGVAVTSGDSIGEVVRKIVAGAAYTNICLQSEALGVTWSANEVTVADDNIAAPNGNTTAEKITETTATADHSLTQSITLSDGVEYTVSIFAKAGTLSRLLFRESTASGTVALFDLSAGTVITSSGSAATIQDVGDGWYRCAHRWTNSTTAARTHSWHLMEDDAVDETTRSYAGNTSKYLYLWGAQSNTGGLQPYVSTTTIAVTRTAGNLWNFVGNGWTAEANGDEVIFRSFDAAAKTDSFAIADVSTTTGVAGSYAESIAGTAPTDTWVKQTDWNVDIMDGTGPSGMTLDQTKGNVYQIQFQWLGFGAISFYIENSVTGDFQLVHRIQYANTNTTPSVQNPTLHLHIRANNGSTTNAMAIQTSSSAIFTEGTDEKLGITFGASNTKALSDTNETVILVVKNKTVFQSKENRVDILPELLTVSVLGAGNAKSHPIRVYLNPILGGTPSFSDVDSDNSVVATDTAATTISGGSLVASLTLAKTDSTNINLEPIAKELIPGSLLAVTAQIVGGTSDVEVAATWKELF